MSIRRHRTNKPVVMLAVCMTAALMGCRGSAKTAEQIGQAEEFEIVMPVETIVLSKEDTDVSEYESQTSELTQTVNKETLSDTQQQAESDDEHDVSPEREKPQPPEGWELKFASEDWGLSFGVPGTQPVGNAAAEDLAWYDAYYVGADDDKVIYLTFDCGYENGNTEPILDALHKHNVQATFFVVGHFLETAPDMVKRMVEDGHAVGNHTYHHLDMPTISDQEMFQKEMDDVANLFNEITGTKLSMYYRPPQGKCNALNLQMAEELGYSTIFWSLAYVDWNTDAQPGHAEAFEKLTGRIHPGAIVLLHNTSQTNGEILDELLTKWEEMGYSFKPLSELTDI